MVIRENRGKQESRDGDDNVSLAQGLRLEGEMAGEVSG